MMRLLHLAILATVFIILLYKVWLVSNSQFSVEQDPMENWLAIAIALLIGDALERNLRKPRP